MKRRKGEKLRREGDMRRKWSRDGVQMRKSVEGKKSKRNERKKNMKEDCEKRRNN